MSDSEIIHLIKSGKHSQALAKLYKIYPAIRKYVIERGADQATAQDIFQDALVIFIEKTADPNFKLSSAISTYLFGICKNLCREKNRESQKQFNQEFEGQGADMTKTVDEFYEEERKYRALDKILLETGKKCMDLLKLFYHDQLSMKTIARMLGYTSETSAKTQKYKCLEKARNLTESILNESKTIGL